MDGIAVDGGQNFVVHGHFRWPLGMMQAKFREVLPTNYVDNNSNSNSNSKIYIKSDSCWSETITNLHIHIHIYIDQYIC